MKNIIFIACLVFMSQGAFAKAAESSSHSSGNGAPASCIYATNNGCGPFDTGSHCGVGTKERLAAQSTGNITH